MLNEQKQQALLISGESGAGKTEAVKACLRHIVKRSSDAAAGSGGSAGPATQRAKYVEDCIMQANPLLEALGNAKTVRNGNSSRFGKWIEVQFDASGFITSSRVTSYLLEKSRVTEANHSAGERTYHSLYQLCKGCTREQKAQLKLVNDPKDFKYIGSSASVVVPTVEDVSWWKATCQAMDTFNFSADDQSALRQVLAATLHLGNLSFAVLKVEMQDDGSKVDDPSQPHLKAIEELIGLKPGSLEPAVTVKSVGKFPVVQVPQPPAKALATRDAFAKALYGGLFEWTIQRLNTTMTAGAGPADGKRTIGMLDIFGFEAFDKNSLEQLLINFANEKLQEHFNEYIFRMEEAECRAEGVVCPKLEFADNSAVMKLMTTKPTGIISLINEEVIVPNGSDSSLLGKLQQNHRGNSTFKNLHRSRGDGFTIVHYAGEVGYQIAGFVDKNRDQLPGELLQLLTTSSMPLLEQIFNKPAEEPPPKSARGGGGARGRSGGGGKRSALASQFVDSLDQLMAVLSRTTPHFVRCVKPNYAQNPNDLDGAYVMRQLREMGMVHVVRARKQGFAHRYPFERFLHRYAYLLRNRQIDLAAVGPFYIQHIGSPNPPEGERKECVTILGMMVSDKVLDADGWAVGTAKVFLKEAMQQQLEVAREAYLVKVVQENLTKAIESRDIATLESAIGDAQAVQLGGDLVTKARQLLQLLQAQLAAAAKLQEAMAAREVGQLEYAIAQCANVGLVTAEVQQAQQLLNTLKAQAEASAALTAALARNDAAMIEAALGKAAATGLNSGQVKEAQRRLDTLKRTAELEQEIVSASKGEDHVKLGQLVEKAEEINLATQAVAVGKARLSVLQEALRLQGDLANAGALRDAAGVKEVLARAKAAGAPQTSALKAAVANAEGALKEIERQAAAEAEAARVAEEAERMRAQQPPSPQQPASPSNLNLDLGGSGHHPMPRMPSNLGRALAGAPAQSPRRPLPYDDVWIPSAEGGKTWPCVHLQDRLQILMRGCQLIKVGRVAHGTQSTEHTRMVFFHRHAPSCSSIPLRWLVPLRAGRRALFVRGWYAFARTSSPDSPMHANAHVHDACLLSLSLAWPLPHPSPTHRWRRANSRANATPRRPSCSRRTASVSCGTTARSASTSPR